MIAEKIRQIKDLRQRKNMAISAEYESTRPEKSDLSEIPSLFERFNEVKKPECKDNTKIFVMLMFFLYSPQSFINNQSSRSGIRKSIAKVLGVSKSSVTKHFNDAKSLILNHRGFREEAERLYRLIV